MVALTRKLLKCILVILLDRSISKTPNMDTRLTMSDQYLVKAIRFRIICSLEPVLVPVNAKFYFCA